MARILLADDDAASLEVMNVALTAQGHEVFCASDGREAYELALKEKPDLVFLDVIMPVADGYEACQLIRNDPEIRPDMPVVFLTSMDADRKRLEQVGATDYLSKRHVVAEVQDMLVKHLGPAANPSPRTRKR